VVQAPLLALGGLLAAAAGRADTGSSLGDRTGEGTSAFAGIAQSPGANLFTGGAATAIGIMVPPGRKNMTPQLSLQYSSSGGPGPFGYGWDLPIGRIERSTKWGTPRCGFHENDFVLVLPTGAVELLPEGGSGDVFRPRVEEAYVRAERNVAQNHWVVRDRAGLTYTFGDVDSTRVANTAPPVFMQSSPCRFTTIWALRKVEDPDGQRHGDRME